MIAIKGMEMPKSCLECPLTCPRWDFNIGCKCCKAIIGHHEEYGKHKTERHPNCPLVEIVTCKDCKHCCHITDTPKVLLCEKHNCQQVSKNFYCADGERKE